MSKPLVSDVYTLTRAFLGDNDVAGGSDFLDATLQPFYQAAYEDLFRLLNNMQSAKIQTEAFYNLPANTSTLDPASAGISSLGNTIAIEERGNVTAFTITGATPGTNQLTLTVNHTLATGAIVTVNGVAGISSDVNGVWAITAPNATSVILNGCTATGTYTPATGVMSYSPDNFVPMQQVQRIDLLSSPPGTMLNAFAIEGAFFRFYPAQTIRQLRIIYDISGSAPTTTSDRIQIDDSLDYLSLQTAFRAARSRDLAIGDQLASDADFVARNIQAISVRNLQNLHIQRPPFRYPRNQWWIW